MNAYCGMKQSMVAADLESARTHDKRKLQAARFMEYLRSVARTNLEPARTTTSEAAWVAAYQLVYREYLKSELCDEQPSGLYYSEYQTLPGSLTFILGDEKTPFATASVVADGAHGLPCEQIFPEQIEAIRRERGTPAEIMLLAVNSDSLQDAQSQSLRSRDSFNALVNLVFGIFKHLDQHTDITEAVVLVNPRHRAVYECVGFRTLADARSYPSRRGLPAVPLHMSVDHAMSFFRQLSEDASAENVPASTEGGDSRRQRVPESSVFPSAIPISSQADAHHAKP